MSLMLLFAVVPGSVARAADSVVWLPAGTQIALCRTETEGMFCLRCHMCLHLTSSFVFSRSGRKMSVSSAVTRFLLDVIYYRVVLQTRFIFMLTS